MNTRFDPRLLPYDNAVEEFWQDYKHKIANQGRGTTPLTESITVGDAGSIGNLEKSESPRCAAQNSTCGETNMKNLDAMVQGGDWLGIAKAITYGYAQSIFQDAPEQGRSKERAMLSGRLSEISQTSIAESGSADSAEIKKSAPILEVPPMNAASREGALPLSVNKTFTCQRNGIDGFISAADSVIDRTESDEPEWGDSDTARELSAGIQRGCR